MRLSFDSKIRSTLSVFAALTFIGTSFSPTRAQADLFSVPPLHMQTFESLGLPPLVSKLQIQKAVQIFAEQNYGQAFVDIGDMSDFMHGHILWDPSVHDSKLDRPLAILFHTQEFPNLRKDGYLFNGKPIDPFNRNWISWQLHFQKYQVNDLTPAYMLMPKPEVQKNDQKNGQKSVQRDSWSSGNQPSTVSADMLDQGTFGADVSERSTTVFFYRFACDELTKRKLHPMTVYSSNLIKIRIKNIISADGKPADPTICLALVNDACNTSKETSKDCPGKFDLAPIDHRNK